MKYLKTTDNTIYGLDENTFITVVYQNNSWNLSPINFVELERDGDISYLSEIEINVICKGNLPDKTIEYYMNYLQDSPNQNN